MDTVGVCQRTTPTSNPAKQRKLPFVVLKSSEAISPLGVESSDECMYLTFRMPVDGSDCS